MKPRVCRGCKEPIVRRVLAPGRQEHKGHFEKKLYHDMYCRRIETIRRRNRQPA